MRTHVLLSDRTNIALLRLLQQRPRASIAELARTVRMSAPAVRERVLRLEESGVLQGYRAEISPAALGYHVAAFIRCRPLAGHERQLVRLAHAMPEVTECHRVTGEDCYVIKVFVPDIPSLERVVDQLLAHGDTTTSIVQSTPIGPRGLPIGDAS